MDNDVSEIIARTALIENILNQVIIEHTSPREEVYDFFWNVLLDSSIMQLGSKLKVAMAISQGLDFKLNKDSMHKVVSYRNAFAHHALNSHPTLLVGTTPDKDEQHYMLHIISSSGKIYREKRIDALAKFNENYEIAKQSLINLKSAIKNGK